MTCKARNAAGSCCCVWSATRVGVGGARSERAEKAISANFVPPIGLGVDVCVTDRGRGEPAVDDGRQERGGDGDADEPRRRRW